MALLQTSLLAAISALVLLGAAPRAHATEGGLGRPLTAMQIQPFSGLVPPDPGMQWSLGYTRYRGDIGGTRQVPIAGQISYGAEVDIDLFTATGVYIWPTASARWNFASMLTLPHIGTGVTATLDGPLARRSVEQHATGPFDLYFAPVIASYHVDEMTHWSLGAYVYAPTANYSADRLANEGLNVWTVSPTVGYTRLFLKGGIEVSASAALDWYSENEDTGYRNGLVARLEALSILRVPSGWGVGLVGGWIEQVQDDRGALADRLDGFRGRSLGAGPIVTFNHSWENGDSVSFSLRYVEEFGVRNRFSGSPLMLSAGVSF